MKGAICSFFMVAIDDTGANPVAITRLWGHTTKP